MRNHLTLKNYLVGILLMSSLASCGKAPGSSTLKTVDVPQTQVKGQNYVGFCWSYGTMGFLETLMLKKTGQALDLSEEALGFYRMAEELVALSRNNEAADLETEELVQKKVFESLEGWTLMFNPTYNPGFRARGSLQLVKDYGVVPESVWSYKFLTDKQSKEFSKAVFSGFAALMKAQGRNNVTRDMVFGLLASPGAYGSRPPSEFNYVFPNGENRKILATDFASQVIGFSPDDYTYMIPDKQIDFNKIITAVKLTLSRGINVPLSYSIYKGSQNNWDASYSAKNLDPANLTGEGGHLVLITDFVNLNGRPGAVSNANLQAEMNKPSTDLDYLVIKNSWNTHVQSPLLRLPGYFTMDQSYLQLLSQKQTDIRVIVPRDIAFQVRYGD